jgi:hypothetical protein
MPLSYQHAPLEKALANERGGGAENLPIFFPDNPGNSASRARTPKSIGSRRSNIRCGGGYLEGFGLRIMNPPL